MAEAWVNSLRANEWKAYSAGIEKHGMNPSAVSVMTELGVDMTGHYSKHIDELGGQHFDLIVTVCDHAAEHCPSLPSATPTKHVPFDDPPTLAKLAKNELESLNSYRLVRDQIREFIDSPALAI
jgi:arsenate reductase